MSGPPDAVNRRTALELIGTASLSALAGCHTQSNRGTTTTETPDGTDAPPATTDAPASTEPGTETGTAAETSARGRIRVDDATLRDTRLGPRLAGFEPNTEVTLVATATDALDRTWRSEATFKTDDAGVVSLAEQAPVAGTYDGRRPMGFVWSMRMDAIEEPSFFVPGPRELPVTLSARVGETELAATELVRRYVDPGVSHRRVSDRSLVGHYYEPTTEGPHPGVVAFHGAGNRPLRNYGRMLASHGVATLAVKWFGEEDPLPNRLARVPVEYAQQAVTWLEARTTVNEGDVGLLGHSKGAEYALLTASRSDDVGAVVAIAPSAYVWTSPTRGISETSWTVDGEPHPTVPQPENPRPPERERGRTMPVGTLRHAIEQASEDALADARIPVEDVPGDVLLIAGGRDGVWPSVPMAGTIVERLDRTGFEHEYRALTYPDAGHVITVPYRPTTYEMVGGGLYLGGEPGAIAAAEAEAWPRTVSWLRDALGTDGA
jgi:nucleolar protein 56